jgi:hypothetical protein
VEAIFVEVAVAEVLGVVEVKEVTKVEAEEAAKEEAILVGL